MLKNSLAAAAALFLVGCSTEPAEPAAKTSRPDATAPDATAPDKTAPDKAAPAAKVIHADAAAAGQLVADGQVIVLDIRTPGETSLEVSLRTLPSRPTVIVLEPKYLPVFQQ